MENFQQLVMKIATAHGLTPRHKTRVQNRLDNFLTLYKTPDHPPYSAIIEKAIVELDENEGSSEESISRFLKKEYKDLPWAHSTLLQHHLAKLCESGIIILTRGKRYVLAGTNLNLNTTTTKSKKRRVKRVWKSDWERQLTRRRRKKQLSQKMNQQKGGEQLEVIEKYSEPNVQGQLFIEDVQDVDNLSELSIPEGPPPGFEFVRVGKSSPLGHNQEMIVERTSSEPSVKLKNDTLELNSKTTVEAAMKSGQGEKSSQAIVLGLLAEPVKRSYRKRLKGHELLSNTPRRSPRLQNTPEQTDEEEKELSLAIVEPREDLKLAPIEELTKPDHMKRPLRHSRRLQNTLKQADDKDRELSLAIVEPQVDLKLAPVEELSKPDHMQRPLRRSKRLSDLAVISEPEVCDLLNSNPSTDLRRPQDDPDQAIGREIVLPVMQQQEPDIKDSELVRADMNEIKSTELITYVRRKKAKFRESTAIVSDAEKGLAIELSKTPRSTVCESVIDPNDPLLGPVKEASIDESRNQLKPDSREEPRGRERKSDAIAMSNLRSYAQRRVSDLGQKMKHGVDVSCNASVLRAGETLLPNDVVPNDKKRFNEEFPKIRRPGRPPKRRQRGNGPGQKMKHGVDVSCNALVRRAGETLLPSDVVHNKKKALTEEFPKARRPGRPPKRRRLGMAPKEKMESTKVREVQVLQQSATSGRRNTRLLVNLLRETAVGDDAH